MKQSMELHLDYGARITRTGKECRCRPALVVLRLAGRCHYQEERARLIRRWALLAGLQRDDPRPPRMSRRDGIGGRLPPLGPRVASVLRWCLAWYPG